MNIKSAHTSISPRTESLQPKRVGIDYKVSICCPHTPELLRHLLGRKTTNGNIRQLQRLIN